MRSIRRIIPGILWVLFAIPALAAAANFSPLSDTGQTSCYDVAGAVIPCPASGEPLYGQDANYHGPPQSYTDNGDGTVTDNNTGLIWQKSTADTDGDSSITSSDAMNWQDAIDYCNALGNGWRLPERIELRSIVDYGRYNPAINSDYFSCQSSYYWSATTLAGSTSSAWYIGFYGGNGHFNYKTGSRYVRCVRAGL